MTTIWSLTLFNITIYLIESPFSPPKWTSPPTTTNNNYTPPSNSTPSISTSKFTATLVQPRRPSPMATKSIKSPYSSRLASIRMFWRSRKANASVKTLYCSAIGLILMTDFPCLVLRGSWLRRSTARDWSWARESVKIALRRFLSIVRILLINVDLGKSMTLKPFDFYDFPNLNLYGYLLLFYWFHIWGYRSRSWKIGRVLYSVYGLWYI